MTERRRLPAIPTFLRWAGSKRLLLPRLQTFVPRSFKRYIEPFAGSACLFFHLQPEHAILGDLNAELVCSLRAVQRNPYVVIECLRRLPVGEKGYYAVRSIDPASLPEASLAARFIYLNHYCFNGIYRTNMNGRFNVPYGPPKSGLPIDERLLVHASRLLRPALIVEDDFEATLAQAEPGDFAYLDPPFAVSGRRVFAQYGPRSFSQIDLPRLRKALEVLDDRGVAFVVSYADSTEARRWLSQWKTQRVQTRRNIAGFVGDRRRSYELVVTNA
jgi:DNA adenine methylase